MNAMAPQTRPELTIRRKFSAPRGLVFRAWTDPDQLKLWCCPTGFTIPHSEADIRIGGDYRSCMRSPEGDEYWTGGTYLEIVPDEKVVFTHSWLDDAGQKTHDTTVTVTLTDAEGGGTSLTLHQSFFLSESARDGHEEGWNSTLDALSEYLAK
ncbi:SRPBCC family protein [Pelagibacterium limicola]|uniref:SRPBCC family protein n=1 Tax=Pelagibacterium limicola TaxID=2791022 RepID=UPI0018AF830F|nr:SRPBCC domain-containing protein [Pelagibacterium limicola]